MGETALPMPPPSCIPETTRMKTATMTCRGLLPLLAAVLLVGCGPDYARIADDMLRKRLVGVEMVDAVKFFEDGGHYYDDPEDEEVTKLDQHILPLLKRLRDELKLAPVITVAPDDRETGIDLLVAMPDSSELRSKLEQALAEAQKTFPGEIFPQWGHDYLAIELYDEEEAAWYREQDELDKKKR